MFVVHHPIENLLAICRFRTLPRKASVGSRPQSRSSDAERKPSRSRSKLSYGQMRQRLRLDFGFGLFVELGCLFSWLVWVVCWIGLVLDLAWVVCWVGLFSASGQDSKSSTAAVARVLSGQWWIRAFELCAMVMHGANYTFRLLKGSIQCGTNTSIW